MSFKVSQPLSEPSLNNAVCPQRSGSLDRHLVELQSLNSPSILDEPSAEPCADGVALDQVVELLLLSSGPMNSSRVKSRRVGATCVLMAIPGLWGWMHGQVLMGGVGVAMALCHYYSDYVSSIIHV